MLFERLLIQNLGIFRGEHCLDLLPPDPTRPIVLVGALNGSGKTTVIESIQLALYGKRAGFGWRGANAYLQYLQQVRNRSAQPTEATIAEITLRLADKRRLRVRRQWSFSKDTPREYVSVFVNGDDQPDMALSENWDEEIERLLPARLSELFFFDGERIESLADSAKSGDVLRTAMTSLLGLDLVDHLTGDLEILRSRQRQRLLSSEDQTLLRGLDADLNASKQCAEDLNQKMASIRTQLDQADKDLIAAKRRLKARGGELFSQREQLRINKAAKDGELKGIESQLREVTAGLLPLALVLRQLQSLAQQMSENEESISLETNQAVRKQLKSISAWIKDRGFPKKIEAQITDYLFKREEKLPSLDKRIIAADPVQLENQVMSLLEARLPRERKVVARLIASRQKLEQEVGQMEERLKRVPERDEVAAAFKDEGAAEAAQSNLIAELNALEEEVKAQNHRKADIERRRDELLAKAIDAGDAQRTVEYCERSLKTLAEFRSKLVKKRREQLETLILEAFRLLSRKPNLIGSIRLDPDTMMLSLLTGEGQILATQQLSAGERQLLAVAMLWGLARASGRPVPVVIDTPLGRLDGEHRRALVERYFPDASHQVILLSTDQEVDADFSRLLDDSVAHRYLIDYSPNERTSSFSHGYFQESPSDAH